MRNILLCFFTAIFIVSIVEAQTYREVKIYLNSPSEVQQLINAGMDFDHPRFNKDNTINVFIDESDYTILQSSGFSYEVLIDDWYTYYSNLPKMNEEEKSLALQKVEEDFGITGFNYGSMGGFYTLAEVNAELDEMFTQYPGLITQKVSIGTSIEGRSTYMVKISDNPTVNENEPQVLYTALIHAREPESMEQMIFFMFYLLENYGTDPEVTYLVDNRELYFIPVINPDGYEYNRTIAPGGGGMWRKNRRNNGGGTYGIDLNRNYGPYSYWNSSNGGSSTYPGDDTYRGTAPFSEPETQTIRDFIATKNLSNALNYHTYGNYLIYPYAALDMETPDSLTFREFAGDMTSFNGYTSGLCIETVGYSVRGSSDDYFYDGDTTANSGKIIAMTPEVGSTGFWPSQSEIIPLAQENLRPNLYYAWVAGESVHLENPNFSQEYFNPGDNVEMYPLLRNKGLSTAYNVDVQVNSLSTFATINSGSATLVSIEARSSSQVTSPMTFTISQSAPAEEEIQLEFVISLNSTVVSKDTINFIIGTPIFVFVDTTNNINTLWTITSTPTNPHWETTTTSYHTSPNSYTDSKLGNYVDDAVVTMTLTTAIDLTLYNNPRLVFWTKFDIESNWDYGQADVSTNNGATWIPLEGAYTEPGVGSFQPNGEPLYDGIQSSWVKEEISLTPYRTAQNKIRFQLNSDGYITRDGWYVDDIGIIIYQIVPVELLSFSASVRSTSIIINWATASEMNNQGFEIQRATGKDKNNLDWRAIGFVDGKGTSTERNYYSFTDKTPVTGKSYYRLKQIDLDGSFRIFDAEMVEFGQVTEYSLEQNYPNPFNPSTKISYTIPNAEHVSLTVYNMLGSKVAVLVDEFQEAGRHTAEFSKEDLKQDIGSGMYVYTLKAGSFTATRKMVVLK